MLSDLNWKRANVRTETLCSRCQRRLLAGQQSIQIDRARVCNQCWDEVRADPTKSAQEYKREFKIGSGSTTRRASNARRSSGMARRPLPSLTPALSDEDASHLVGNTLDRAVADSVAEVLPARDMPFYEAGFDYLVVGRAGVTIVGSEAYSSAVKIEALVSWSSTSIPANVLVYGRNRRDLIDKAVAQREALEEIVAAAKFKFEVPVRVAMCFESVEGIDRTPIRESLGVQIDTVDNIAKFATHRGPVFEKEVPEVVGYLRGIGGAMPAQPSPDRLPASD